MFRIGLTVFILLCSGFTTFAALNTEAIRDQFAKQGRNGWGLQLDGTFLIRSGSEDLIEWGSGLGIHYARPAVGGGEEETPYNTDFVFLKNDLKWGQKTGNRYVNNGLSHLRWTHLLWSWGGFEPFAQYEYNEFIKLQSLTLMGVNLRWIPLRLKDATLAMGLGPMGEWERQNVPVNPFHRMLRMNSYLALRWSPLEPINVSNTTYVQPSLMEGGDLKIHDDFEVAFHVIGGFSLTWNLAHRYDSRPPEGIISSQTEFRQGVRLSF